jgi:hypothetical protein
MKNMLTSPLGRAILVLALSYAAPMVMGQADKPTEQEPPEFNGQYTVALEQGDKINLRSYFTDIGVNDCVRVWIVGPGVSPVYLYAPEQAAIERASECSSPESSRK